MTLQKESHEGYKGKAGFSKKKKANAIESP